jgi:hypothetical protein
MTTEEAEHCGNWLDHTRPIYGVDHQGYYRNTDLILSEPGLLEGLGIVPIVKTPQPGIVMVVISLIARHAVAGTVICFRS